MVFSFAPASDEYAAGGFQWGPDRKQVEFLYGDEVRQNPVGYIYRLVRLYADLSASVDDITNVIDRELLDAIEVELPAVTLGDKTPRSPCNVSKKEKGEFSLALPYPSTSTVQDFCKGEPFLPDKYGRT